MHTIDSGSTPGSLRFPGHEQAQSGSAMQESSVRQGGGDNPVGPEEAAAVARWIWSDSRGWRRLCRTILKSLGNLQGAGRAGSLGRGERRRLFEQNRRRCTTLCETPSTSGLESLGKANAAVLSNRRELESNCEARAWIDPAQGSAISRDLAQVPKRRRKAEA